jgi:glycerol kinase
VSYLLALDEGTTSARAIVFDKDGGIRAVAQREFRQLFPQPGWVEHDAEEIWSTQLRVAGEALGKANLQPRDVAAIGITNQRETTVIWDRETGRPIHHAIVWQDRRTAPFCESLKSQGHERFIQERTGLVIDAYFSASKIAWLLDNVPGARARADAGNLAFGTIDSWIVWNLTRGVHITDVSNASRTMLFDIKAGKWDDDLLRIFRIPASLMPQVRSSSEVYVETTALGSHAIPVAGIAGDQQAALFGQLCVMPGMTKNTYGTGCFMLQCTGDKPVPSRNRLVTTVAWKIGDKLEYALEGSVFVAGAVVQWLRDGLGLVRSADEIEELAASVPDNGGVYIVPAFAGLGAPHWDPFARGTIMGLTRGANKAHLARAALESIAFQVADLLEAIQADSHIPLRELRVDGGAAKNNLLMQFQADLLGVPVVRPAMTETTAAGAAYLAGLAVGLWSDRQDLSRLHQVDRRFEPAMPRRQALELLERWRAALERAKKWHKETSA